MMDRSRGGSTTCLVLLAAPKLRRIEERGGVSATLSWQVGRVKITRIVEMDLPVPAVVIPQAMAAEPPKSAGLYPHFVSADGPHARPHQRDDRVRARASGDHPRQRPEGRRTHALAPLRRIGRPDNPRHRQPLPRPHRRARRPRRRSVQVCGVRATRPAPAAVDAIHLGS